MAIGRKKVRERTISAGALVEALESRVMLDAVSWTGAAGDLLWHTPGNWSSGAVPTGADDVTVSIAGSPVIQFNAASGERAVRSLVCDESLVLSGGHLTVGTVAQIGAPLTLNGGGLIGGAYSCVGSGALKASTSVLSSINAVSFSGVIDCATTSQSRLNIFNGLTGAFTLRMGGRTQVTLIGTQTLSGGTIVFEGNGTTGFDTLGVTPVGGIAAVTLDSTMSIRGGDTQGGFGATIAGGGNTSITSYGLVSADTAGRAMTINIGLFANYGTIEATADNAQVVLGGNVKNFGVLRTSGTASIPIRGVLDNTGNTLNFDATNAALFLDSGGRIQYGTINIATGMALTAAGTLQGVTVNGTVNCGDFLLIRGGISGQFNLRMRTGSNLSFAGTQTVSQGMLTLSNANPGSASTSINIGEADGDTVTFAPSFTVVFDVAARVYLSITSSSPGTQRLVNQGTIRVIGDGTGTGPSFGVGTDLWTNEGVLEALNAGLLSVFGTFQNTGLIKGVSGTVRLDGVLNNTGMAQELNATTGSWVLGDGQIVGGTFNLLDGQKLLVKGSDSAIQNLIVNGEVYSTADRVSITNLSGSVLLGVGGGTLITFVGTQSFGGTIEARPGGGTIIVGNSDGMVFTLTPSAMVLGGPTQLGPGLVFVSDAAGTQTLINHGTIRTVSAAGSGEDSDGCVHEHGDHGGSRRGPGRHGHDVDIEWADDGDGCDGHARRGLDDYGSRRD